MELTDEQRLAVQFLAVDMHDGFISSARELCPNAKIAVDRFHLAQKLNEKLDEVRKEEAVERQFCAPIDLIALILFSPAT
jgi:transposase